METVKNICKKHGIFYIANMESYSTDIINIMNGQIIQPEHNNLLIWKGLYNHFVSHNYNIMKKYYLMAIEHGNSDAMNNLGLYYEKIKEYATMKKYYLMAIKHNNITAMINLALYYKKIGNYKMAKKYYRRAITCGNMSSCFRFDMKAYYFDMYVL